MNSQIGGPNLHEHGADGLKAEKSRTVLEIFRSAVRKVSDLLNSVERSSHPTHPEFDVVDDGWYWNNVKQPSSDPSHKVCFYFDDADLPLLDSCSWAAKFSDNENSLLKFKYCGFAYPAQNKELGALKEWAARFPYAELCTYGVRVFDFWQPGEVVEVLSNGRKSDHYEPGVSESG